MNTNLYKIADLSTDHMTSLLEKAISLKQGTVDQDLTDRELMLIFLNPSLRTRVSFETGMRKLGGSVTTLDMDEDTAYAFEYEPGTIMDGVPSEHVKEAAGVLSRYCDAIAIRASDLVTSDRMSKDVRSWEELKQDKLFASFMKYADVPIINMESNLYHPCQGLGDAMTMKEQFDEPESKTFVLTWTYHPKALPVATPHSQAYAACSLGMDVRIARPPGWELDGDVVSTMEERANETGGSLTTEPDMAEAFDDADVICAKSWGALSYYGNWEKEREKRTSLKDWIVDEPKMERTNEALFMHCLPVRRNVVVTDDVIDSNQSIVIDQAENRKWVQMALLRDLLC